MRIVSGYGQLRDALDLASGPVIVGFFGAFSDKSRKTRPAFEEFAAAHPDLPCFLVDVGEVRDAHGPLGVTMVPTVVEIRDGGVVQEVVGVRTAADYEAAFVNRPAHRKPAGKKAGPAHRVTVYTGAHCSWCTRVKAYLDERRVPYREIDVGRNQAAAQDLVRRTGQTGVPQLDIDGQYVVGFDRPRIDALLGLSPQASAY